MTGFSGILNLCLSNTSRTRYPRGHHLLICYIRPQVAGAKRFDRCLPLFEHGLIKKKLRIDFHGTQGADCLWTREELMTFWKVVVRVGSHTPRAGCSICSTCGTANKSTHKSNKLSFSITVGQRHDGGK